MPLRHVYIVKTQIDNNSMQNIADTNRLQTVYVTDESRLIRPTVHLSEQVSCTASLQYWKLFQ